MIISRWEGWWTFFLGAFVGASCLILTTMILTWRYLSPVLESSRLLKEAYMEDLDASIERNVHKRGKLRVTWMEGEDEEDVGYPESVHVELLGNRLRIGDVTYSMLGADVALAPRAKGRGPWWPKAPILILFNSSSNGEKANEQRSTSDQKPWVAIFLETPPEKERWYTCLRIASGAVPRATAVKEEFAMHGGCALGQKMNALKKASKPCSSTTSNPCNPLPSEGNGEQTAEATGRDDSPSGRVEVGAPEDVFRDPSELALNLLLARLYFDATRSQDCRDSMRAKLQQRLSRLSMPDWLSPLRVADLRFPRAPPRLTQLTVIQSTDQVPPYPEDCELPGWRLGAWIEAEDGLVLTVETSVEWRRSPSNVMSSRGSGSRDEETEGCEQKLKGRWRSSFAASLHRIPLRLELRCSALRGPMELWAPDPPSDVLFWRFSQRPHLELEAFPKLGRLQLFGRKTLAQKVSTWIVMRLKREMFKAVVFPSAGVIQVPFLIGVDGLDDMDWLDSEDEEREQEETDGEKESRAGKDSLIQQTRTVGWKEGKSSKRKKKKKKKKAGEGESIFLAEQWQGKYTPKKARRTPRTEPIVHRRKKTWEELEEEQERQEVQEWMEKEESVSGMQVWGEALQLHEGELDSDALDELPDQQPEKELPQDDGTEESECESQSFFTDEEVLEPPHFGESTSSSRGSGFFRNDDTPGESRSQFRLGQGFSKVRSGFASVLRKNLSLESHKHRAEELSKKIASRFGRHSKESVDGAGQHGDESVAGPSHG